MALPAGGAKQRCWFEELRERSPRQGSPMSLLQLFFISEVQHDWALVHSYQRELTISLQQSLPKPCSKEPALVQKPKSCRRLLLMLLMSIPCISELCLKVSHVEASKLHLKNGCHFPPPPPFHFLLGCFWYQFCLIPR